MQKRTVVVVSVAHINPNSVIKEITDPACGAVVVFTGIVRGETKDSEHPHTTRLEYDAYKAMAEEKMKQVADEIRERWAKVRGLVLVQRIGILEVGDISTLIAASASHRDDGIFEAGRYGIDRVKEIVPVWKKEVGPRGDFWIEGSYFPKPGE